MRSSARLVLEPGGLRTQVLSAFRQAADRHLEGRIGAQRVVAVRIAAGDQQGTEADHLGVAVLDALRRPVVAQAARQPLADPKPISPSSRTPLSEDSRPPSKAATTGLPERDDKPGWNLVLLDTAGAPPVLVWMMSKPRLP
jgi:hypothetical protein